MTDQLPLQDVPRRLFRATPTRLLGWLDCPRRYRFTYLEKPTPPKGPPWAHTSVGASVHTALASWWRLPVERRTTAEVGDLLVRGWLRDGFADDAQSETWREYARDLVQSYVATLDPTDEPIGVERTVAMRTPALALSGRIDRLDERPAQQGTELVVVDYKTGRRTLTTADARTSLALAVYAAAAWRTMRKPCRRVELHHLPTGTVVAADHTEETLRRHLDRAEQIGIEVADAEEAYRRGDDPEALFPPNPGTQCHWCDFSPSCAEGRRAFPPRRPWEGLDSAVGAGVRA